MERYNYTEAGMVPADGGDWVKAEDVMGQREEAAMIVWSQAQKVIMEWLKALIAKSGLDAKA